MIRQIHGNNTTKHETCNIYLAACIFYIIDNHLDMSTSYQHLSRKLTNAVIDTNNLWSHHSQPQNHAYYTLRTFRNADIHSPYSE